MSLVKKEEEYEFFGVHFIASYKQCNLDALVTVSVLQKKLQEACCAAGATVLASIDHQFTATPTVTSGAEEQKNKGTTMAASTFVVLLSESHASIHTYPEHAACFVDLFTCGRNCHPDKFDKVMCDYLQPQLVETKRIERK